MKKLIKLAILLLILYLFFGCAQPTSYEINPKVEVTYKDGSTDTIEKTYITPTYIYDIYINAGDENVPCLMFKSAHQGYQIRMACYVRSFKVLNVEQEKIIHDDK